MPTAGELNGYIYRQGTSPQTRVLISSKNRIYAHSAQSGNVLSNAVGTAANALGLGGGMNQVGVISSFAPTQNRNVQAVRGIGFGDQIAELVPDPMDPLTIAITRTALYLGMMFQVFGYKHGIDGMARALKHHKWPFDIRQEIVISDVATTIRAGAKGLRTPSTLPPPASSPGYGIQIDALSMAQSAVVTYYEACWFTSLDVTYASDSSLVAENGNISVTDILSDPSAIYGEAVDTGLQLKSVRYAGLLTSNAGVTTGGGINLGTAGTTP